MCEDMPEKDSKRWGNVHVCDSSAHFNLAVSARQFERLLDFTFLP
jgi:hypothetical protein